MIAACLKVNNTKLLVKNAKYKMHKSYIYVVSLYGNSF